MKRKALVIGAGSGMGLATARILAADHDLVVADVSQQGADRAAAETGRKGVVLDIADRAALQSLASDVGRFDALIITAGLSMSMADFERVMAVNLGGTANALDVFLPSLNAGGAAVCMASIAGHLTTGLSPELLAIIDDPLKPDMPALAKAALPAELAVSGMAYGLSKIAVMRLVQGWALRFGQHGARLCSVSPGCIDTPMGLLERDLSPDAQAAVPLGPVPRVGTPEEVAEAICFLASPKASYITGCDLLVDGGWVGAISTGGPDSPFAQALASGRAKE